MEQNDGRSSWSHASEFVGSIELAKLLAGAFIMIIAGLTFAAKWLSAHLPALWPW